MEHFTITGILTKDQCTEIINKLPDESPNPGGFTMVPGYWTDTDWNNTHKTFNTHRIRLTRELAEYVSSLIKPVSIDSEPYIITKHNVFYANYYNKNDTCTKHKDLSKYSICIPLNDEFEGGIFYIEDKPVELKAGDGILFPGDTDHEVSKVISGTRWSLCIWIME